MTVTYTKSLLSDFGGNLIESQIKQEIENETSITTTIHDVNRNGDIVNFIFEFALSGAEQTAFNGVCSAHVPIVPRGIHNNSIFFSDSLVDSPSWQIRGVYTLPADLKELTHIYVTAKLKEGVSYSVRVFSLTFNADVVNLQGLTNDNMISITMGTPANYKANDVLEIHTKADTTDSYAYIKQLQFYYN